MNDAQKNILSSILGSLAVLGVLFIDFVVLSFFITFNKGFTLTLDSTYAVILFVVLISFTLYTTFNIEKRSPWLIAAAWILLSYPFCQLFLFIGTFVSLPPVTQTQSLGIYALESSAFVFAFYAMSEILYYFAPDSSSPKPKV